MNKRLLVDEIAAAIRTRPAPVGAASLAETIMEEVFPSDGCAVEGVFYPFMVDGERNPALEWQHQTLLLENDWYPDTWVISKGLDIGSTHWVAVGVKETNE